VGVQRIGQCADTVDPNYAASAAALDPLRHCCDYDQVSHQQVASGGPGCSSRWAIVGGVVAEVFVDGVEAVVVFRRHKRQRAHRLLLPAGGLGEDYEIGGGLHMTVAPGACPRAAVGHDLGDDIL